VPVAGASSQIGQLLIVVFRKVRCANCPRAECSRAGCFPISEGWTTPSLIIRCRTRSIHKRAASSGVLAAQPDRSKLIVHSVESPAFAISLDDDHSAVLRPVPGIHRRSPDFLLPTSLLRLLVGSLSTRKLSTKLDTRQVPAPINPSPDVNTYLSQRGTNSSGAKCFLFSSFSDRLL
jgi:hypothetical protein